MHGYRVSKDAMLIVITVICTVTVWQNEIYCVTWIASTFYLKVCNSLHKIINLPVFVCKCNTRMQRFVRTREELSLRKCGNENAGRVFGSSN